MHWYVECRHPATQETRITRYQFTFTNVDTTDYCTYRTSICTDKPDAHVYLMNTREYGIAMANTIWQSDRIFWQFSMLVSRNCRKATSVHFSLPCDRSYTKFYSSQVCVNF
uniref:Uncharacterized protein n=1 Tax=Cacopsylla melanoneura TaxID=428564 RepID=A0A8D8Z572_9HEMI